MKHNYIHIGVCLWAISLSVCAQDIHEHSACLDDSISPMKEAILSEVTVQGIAGIQRLKDAASPFMVVSPKQLHNALGTNLVDAVGHLPGLSQISTGTGISKPVIRGLGYNRVVVVELTKGFVKKVSNGATSMGLRLTKKVFIQWKF